MKSFARLFAATIVLLASAGAGAASLEVRSALSEPFEAGVSFDDAPQSVALAPVDAYEARGLDYAAALDGFTVELVRRGGSTQATILSAAAIREPAFHILLELNGDPERVVEFGVVLDVSALGNLEPAPLPRVRPARSVRGDGAIVANVVPVNPDSSAVRPAGPVADVRPAAASQHGPVRRGETLWAISRDHARRVGANLSITMRAIAAANPQAFIGGDINRLRVGAVLRLPGGSSPVSGVTALATAPPAAPAGAQAPTVAPASAPAVATPVPAGAPPVATPPLAVADARIARIEAGIETVGSTGSTLVATGAQLDQRLDSLGAKMQALRERMRAQTEQVRQLAQRAERVGDLARRADATTAAAARAAMAASPSITPEPAVAGVAATATETASVDSATAATSGLATSATATNSTGTGATAPVAAASSGDVAPQAAEQVSANAPVPAATTPAGLPKVADTTSSAPIPGSVRPPAAGMPDLDTLIARYGVPAAVVLGAVLLVALLVIAYRRLRGRGTTGVEREEAALFAQVAAKTGQGAEGVDPLDFDESELANEILTEGALATPDTDVETAPPPPVGVSDILTEIDVYVAYGQVDTAREKLLDGLEEFPDSDELRSRLEMLNNPQTLGTTADFSISLDEPDSEALTVEVPPDNLPTAEPAAAGGGDNVIPFTPRQPSTASLYDLGIATDSGDEDDDDPAGNHKA